MPQQIHEIPVLSLGQTGYRFDFDGFVVYIDPYLSHSVQEHEGSDLVRRVPIKVPPDKLADAGVVLVTHVHRDHCDQQTLVPLSLASPGARFIGPAPVIEKLAAWGIQQERLVRATSEVVSIAPGLSVIPVPAAHPQIAIHDAGGWCAIGYLMEWRGRRLYHAGDTSVCDDLIKHAKARGSVDVAFLPVNEANYYKARRGIIGNMSVREAFQLAEELDVRLLVPTHWDMFEANSVFEEEINLLFEKLSPKFRLVLNPTMV